MITRVLSFPIVLFTNFHGFAGNLNLCENTTNKAVLNCCQIQIKKGVSISRVGRGGGPKICYMLVLKYV